MNIYILREDGEAGPFSWVDISLLLNRDELTEDAIARINDECKTLAEWGFWAEGAEVELEWDEVSALLEAGIVDLDAPAKFEGAEELSDLGDVIRRSEEVCVDGPGEFPEDSPARSFSPGFPSRRTGVLIGAACGALVLVGGCLFAVFQLRTPTGTRSADIQKAEAVQPSPASEQEGESAAPARIVASSAETLTSNDHVPPSPAVEPAPAVAALPVAAEETTAAPVSAVAKVEAAAAAVEPLVASRAPAAPLNDEKKAAVPQQAAAAAPLALPAKAPQTASATRPQPTPETAAPQVGDFFKIESVKYLKKVPKDGFGVWKFSTDQKKNFPMDFQPCLVVEAKAKENIRAESLIARAYFFDETNKLIASRTKPSPAGVQSKFRHHEMPVLFYKDKTDRLYFEVPEKIRDTKWKAVVVFGDKNEAQSACFPITESDFLLNYPDKALVYDRTSQRVVRKAAMDPLIEHVVKTRNPKMPQITLFLRPPKGVSDASEVQGVLAICVLANSLEEMQRELRKEEMPGDYSGLFGFANKHKLAIVAWGSRRLWDPGKNYDDLTREQARNIDESLDTVANAWERGVKELGEKFGIPQKDFLLWGNCGSAQWAQRLCLRKPEYFLAVHVHMPGSYDKPTPEAANVMWCLTIGELEGGYERSKRWVKTVRDMGYPIVYKAIPGLGHSGHPNAAALGFEFYNYALSRKKELEERRSVMGGIANLQKAASETQQPWPSDFQKPLFFGDMVNQEVRPFDEGKDIPSGFRIALPTKKLADIWARDN